MTVPLAATPPMGWNSWNQVRCHDLTEQVVRDAADALVDRGLAALGYRYVVVDDCWQGPRTPDGVLTADPVRFPSGIAALAEYVHARGLLFGLYAVPGTLTCANQWDAYPVLGLGSLGREDLDARTFAEWGVDYLKYDWCRADEVDGLEHRAGFARMRDALAATGRPIVYGISEYGRTHPWTWAAPVAQLWRTTEDIRPSWASVLAIVREQAGLGEHAGPGGWNDPDMLQLGNGPLHDGPARAHVGLWAMLAAPLFLGTDVAALPEADLAVVANPELVAIDQDPLGRAARLIRDDGGAQVWVRPLADGDLAVALLNLADTEAVVAIDLATIGADAPGYAVRDVWARADAGPVRGVVSASVGAHDLALLRLRPAPTGRPAVAVTLEAGATGRIELDFPATGVDTAPGLRATAAGPTALDVVAAPDAAPGTRALPLADGVAYVRVVPPPPAPGRHALADLTPLFADLPHHRDLTPAGAPLTVAGAVAPGLGVRGPAEIEFHLGGRGLRLTGAVGVDDDTLDLACGPAAVSAVVLGDGRELWRTARTLRSQERADFDVDVTGVEVLALRVGTGHEPEGRAHADWLDPVLVVGP